MWAQLITMRLKPGKDGEVQGLVDMLRATERPGSGLVRSLVMRDANEPNRIYTLVVFESEEQARARENDAQRQEELQPAREAMADMFDGPPEFVDLTVVGETVP